MNPTSEVTSGLCECPTRHWELSVWRTEKRVKRLLCGSLMSDSYVHRWLSDRENQTSFWRNVMQCAAKFCVLIFMSFFSFYFTQKTAKHVQLLLLPRSKILIQILKLIPFFLLGLCKAMEEALEFLLQTHLPKKRKLFWNVLESHPFCFISNCRSEQNKVSFFPIFI